MNKEWFVLHTLTGQENKAQKSILARTKLENMGEYIGQCIIPTERVSEMHETKDGRKVKRTVTKKFFPGYVLAELALYDDSKGKDLNGKRQIFEPTWTFLRMTPGVIGFIGGERPMPLSKAEMDAILSSGKGGRDEAPARPKINFNVGDTVKVNDGPFLGLSGVVSVVDPDKGKLKVEVEVFNRKVLVDAESWQVEKMSEEDIVAANNPAQ